MSLNHNVRYAEIISAAAVVVSLIFVGFEIRQSNNLATSEAVLSLNSEINEANHLVVANADLAELFAKALGGDETLSAAELMRLESFGKSRMNTWEAAWIAHNREFVDDSSFDAYMRAACGDVRPMREMWDSWKTGFNPGFVRFIDERCTEE